MSEPRELDHQEEQPEDDQNYDGAEAESIEEQPEPGQVGSPEDPHGGEG